MNTISLAAALSATLLAGPAVSADAPAAGASKTDGLRIESEAQFVRDYGDRIERMAAGVYVVTRGPLAGKVVALGDAGLEYDLAALRARTPQSLRERAALKSDIRQLEAIRARNAAMRAEAARLSPTKAAVSGALTCWYNSGKGLIPYSAYVNVNATVEFYLSNGGGGLNFYYARAFATASGYAAVPSQMARPHLSYNTIAENRITGQRVQKSAFSFTANGGGTTTGYVYSGPDFSHDMYANARVTGSGDCFGYASISDTDPFN